MARYQWLILGLGNPGSDYSHNRHNVGYWCVNRLARLHGINLKARRLATIGEGSIGSQSVLLAKPRTYVNRSGHAAAALLRHTGLDPDHLLVICDDLDLPLGRLRLRSDGGHGGHNGLRSITRIVGSGDFPRLRIGIDRPTDGGEPSWDPDVVALWVLSDPTPEDAKILHASVAVATDVIEMSVRDGVQTAMNRFNP
jgi:PTH1 family peptidyl-tRNA hydrolase